MVALQFELACELQVGCSLCARSRLLAFLNQWAEVLDIVVLDRSSEGVGYMSVLIPSVGWIDVWHQSSNLYPYLSGKRELGL